jgi:ubiquinone/menaquinone biosynthesis C-methylase UbiE
VTVDPLAGEQSLGEHAQRAARTYGAAADHYADDALSFWDRFGAATVDRLPLASGQAVLDLCCGAGASAIPAARRVGPAGSVLAIDVATPLVELARVRAARAQVRNLEFRISDATRTGLPDGGFDAVVCVFGVFFAADKAAFVAEMWRLVRPGGVLGITTWGEGLFEPGNSYFWDAVRAVEPALYKAFNPWDEITSAAALADLFASAGTRPPEIAAVPGEHDLGHPDRFWDVVLGSGYRATVDALSPLQRDQVREQVLCKMRSSGTTAIRTDVLYAVALR